MLMWLLEGSKYIGENTQLGNDSKTFKDPKSHHQTKQNRAPSGQRSNDEAGGVSKVLVGIAQEAVGDPHKPRPDTVCCLY